MRQRRVVVESCVADGLEIATLVRQQERDAIQLDGLSHTRDQAIRDSAVALERTSSPVILLTWYGAHTWVMTGFRADADPLRDPTAVVSGAYILDPWYPTISSIWGASDPPGFFHDTAKPRPASNGVSSGEMS